VAKCICCAHCRLCRSDALLSRFAIPKHRLGVILGHASAVVVRNPEVGLREGVALLSRLAPPRYALGVILGHALAVEVQKPQAALCGSVATGSLLF